MAGLWMPLQEGWFAGFFVGPNAPCGSGGISVELRALRVDQAAKATNCVCSRLMD